MVLCIDCSDTPEFRGFFEFAEHILFHNKKELTYPELIDWAIEVLDSETYITWKLMGN